MIVSSRIKLWRSRVARRVFLLFLACTFLPLIVQALLTGHWVEQQLVEGAEERLDTQSRAAQMSIVAELQHLERSLELFAAGVVARGDFPEELSEQVQDDFTGFALERTPELESRSLGDIGLLPTLTDEEREFIESGKTLLAQGNGPGERAELFLVRALAGGNAPPRTLHARLRQEHFWNPERLDAGDSEILVTDAAGRPLFATIPEAEVGQDLQRALGENPHGVRLRWKLRGREYLGSCRTVFMMPQFHASWRVLYSEAEADILAPVARFRRAFLLVLALTFWLVLLASLRQIQRVLRPIEELHRGTVRLANQNFKKAVEVHSQDEFKDLADSFNAMSRSINRHMRIARDLHAVGMALSCENDSERVIEIVLHSSQRMLNAESGCIFLVTGEGGLELARAHLDAEGRIPGPAGAAGERALTFSLDPPRSIAAHAITKQETVQLSSWKSERALDLSEEGVFELSFEVQREAVMAVPLRDHQGEIIGVLQVGRHPDGFSTCPFNDEERRLLEAIASQGALALSKNNLILSFRRMVVSMTEVFAMAVDEKSPYTGAHCRRVPELTMMLAESARRSIAGSLAEFHPTNAELFELEIAAQLHDCGKVVTPVHVMDKATKLETIHDRMDLVELRFMLLAREARLALLEERLQSVGVTGEDPGLERELSARLTELADDCEFLRHCNLPAEGMKEEDCRRVRAVAAKYSLEAPDGETVSILDDEEVESLTILNGTLTQAERKIINDHILVTIRMLDGLHYPEELSRVALLAGSHHERVDGKGYPYGLTREQIPLEGRIMAIADVFEALTDADRPYKKGKDLQEALEILGGMAVSGHLDPELFQHFIDERIYLRFAERHMSPARIVPVDFSRIPGYVPPASHNPFVPDAKRRSA